MFPFPSYCKNLLLFFNLKFQPLDIFLPHVLHPSHKLSKWCIPELVVTKTYVTNEGEDGIDMKRKDYNINDMGQYI